MPSFFTRLRAGFGDAWRICLCLTPFRHELLRRSVLQGDARRVHLLLRHGANPHIRDHSIEDGRDERHGLTAVHLAAQQAHLPIIELLHRHGANFCVARGQGQSALTDFLGSPFLQAALERGDALPSASLPCLQALLRAGAHRYPTGTLGEHYFKDFARRHPACKQWIDEVLADSSKTAAGR